MRPSLTLATLAASVAVGFGVIASPAGVASADEDAQATISRLQQEGYTVNVDRVGSKSIQDCVVTSVRNPQTQTDLIRDYYGKKDENGNRKYRIIEVVTSQSISVSLDCT
ncbi:hypothetical protein [Mycolicibacterium arenosum]|uniref:PepSY domain-containing protein n=1 Tax=Mycolicibacterium arenosum TaxID=2952157 RepID=A0ABT1LUS5_9MYCO|nr:hypothetical protein [Mycolicibacterium sp. CAU 1645]MCP9270655.1 hypothetical protein [Mycolicibacterium sp. CAU 1645]